jgi:hypothetical protein
LQYGQRTNYLLEEKYSISDTFPDADKEPPHMAGNDEPNAIFGDDKNILA